MAEVLAVVGSIGAIVNIIDATNKAIMAIHNLCVQWQDADLVVLSLASQLSAFKAALRRIQTWLDSEVPAAHHQLVMDLDETLSFCNILATKIDALSAEWESLLEDPRNIDSRWKVTVGSKSLDNVLVLVERQTSALTLLLTACNCQTMTEQKQLLEKPRTRKILQNAKADSASLFVHQDTTSRMSRLTDNLSKMSVVFDFDPAVFSSNVYHRVFRGSLKYRLRQQQQQQRHQPHALGLLHTESSNDELDDITQVDTRETTPTLTPNGSPDLRNPTAWTLSHRQSLTLVRLCETHMLEDCDRFAACYVEQLAVRDSEHTLKYFDDQAGQITRRISQAHIIWRDPTFQQLLVGGPSGTLLGGPSMTLCRFFAHQMKALGDDRFQHQVGDCLATLARAYETASMHRAIPSSGPDNARRTDYSVFTAWSGTTTRPMSDALTVVISVPLAETHYEMCSQTDVTEELALSLQPLMYDVKYCSPTKFTFVLLLSETEHFIDKLPKMCFPIAPFAHTYYLNVVLAEIVRLFRLSNEETQCDYLTIWDNQHLSERILSSVELVSKKGQVTVENGVLRAKLLPLI